jgi:hypothetical protein
MNSRKSNRKNNKNNNGNGKGFNSNPLYKQPKNAAFGGALVHRVRQVYYPSATTFQVSGTGVVYTAATGVLSGTTNDYFWSLYFRLGDVASPGDYSALFDQYKMVSATLHVIPQFNVTNTTFTGAGVIGIVEDYDNATPPTTITALQQYETMQVYSPFTPFKKSLVPRLAIPTGTGFVNSPPKWVDVADTTIQHYGLKGYYDAVATGASFTMVCEVVWEFRSTV